MGQVRISIGADTKAAKKDVAELHRDLTNKLTKAKATRTPARQGSGNAGTAAGAAGGAAGGGGLGVMGMIKGAGAIGAIIAVASAIKQAVTSLDLFKKATDGAMNSGKISTERVDNLAKLEDRARRNGTDGITQYGMEKGAEIAFGSERGQALFDRAGVFISDQLTNNFSTMAEMGCVWNDMPGLKDANTGQRFDILMEKLISMRNSGRKDEATYYVGQIFGMKNAAEFNQMATEYVRYKILSAQISQEYSSAIGGNEGYDAANAQQGKNDVYLYKAQIAKDVVTTPMLQVSECDARIKMQENRGETFAASKRTELQNMADNVTRPFTKTPEKFTDRLMEAEAKCQ